MRERGFRAGETNLLRCRRQQQSSKTNAPSMRKRKRKTNNNKPQRDSGGVVKTVNLTSCTT